MSEHEEQPSAEEQTTAVDPLATADEPNPQARREMEVKILNALLQRGGAAPPVQLAVALYALPDEISEPLEELEEFGYIARQEMKRGMYYELTPKGHGYLRGRKSQEGV